MPNGYGGITKLRGNLRRPWRVRVTTGWDIDNGKAKQLYKILGYYATRKEAMEALANWNSGKPVETETTSPTLSEVFDMWMETRTDLSDKTRENYISSFKCLESILESKIQSLRLIDYETQMKNSGKSQHVLSLAKNSLSGIYKYAYAHGYVTVDQAAMIKYLDPKLIASGESEKIERIPFSDTEITWLWENQQNQTAAIMLVLIHTGLRVNELLKNPKVNWQDDAIHITESKTDAGVRIIPIIDKIKPLYLRLRAEEMPKYTTLVGRLAALPLEHQHHCHDTRHTCISRLVSAEIDDRIVKMIAGHAGNDITFKVYTHRNLKLMRSALEKI